MSTSDMRRAFRERIQEKRLVVAPGVGDAMAARLVRAAGFEAVYMSGYAVEGTYGKPDVGLLTLTEMARRAAEIADVAGLPLLADADTGYGNAINVIRTVREFERAGVAGLQLEDQALPKKCGSMPGKVLVSTAEMVGKIKAAVDARVDPNLLVIGRTDVLASEGIDAALDRLGAYAEAGADMLMALGPYDEATAARLIREAPGRFLYLNSETFTMPMIANAELDRLGASVVVYPLAATLAAAHAVRSVLGEIREQGTTLAFSQRAMLSSAEFNAAMGLETIHEQETRYGS